MMLETALKLALAALKLKPRKLLKQSHKKRSDYGAFFNGDAQRHQLRLWFYELCRPDVPAVNTQ